MGIVRIEIYLDQRETWGWKLNVDFKDIYLSTDEMSVKKSRTVHLPRNASRLLQLVAHRQVANDEFRHHVVDCHTHCG